MSQPQEEKDQRKQKKEKKERKEKKTECIPPSRCISQDG
jgi:hypothetical protein